MQRFPSGRNQHRVLSPTKQSSCNHELDFPRSSFRSTLPEPVFQSRSNRNIVHPTLQGIQTFRSARRLLVEKIRPRVQNISVFSEVKLIAVVTRPILTGRVPISQSTQCNWKTTGCATSNTRRETRSTVFNQKFVARKGVYDTALKKGCLNGDAKK